MKHNPYFFYYLLYDERIQSFFMTVLSTFGRVGEGNGRLRFTDKTQSYPILLLISKGLWRNID